MSYDIVNTSSEVGFKITADSSAILTQVQVRIASFESVSAGRTLTLRIRNGSGLSGTLLYNNNFIVSNQNPGDFSFNITGGPSFTTNSSYTITLQDITSGGTSTGFVLFYGVQSDSTYISYNTSVYPKLTFSSAPPSSIVWTQSSDLGVDSQLNTSSEQGFQFTSSITGTLSNATVSLVAFEGVQSGRTVRFKIRNGAGLSGSVLYTNDYVIPNTFSTSNTYVDYIFSISSGPSLTSSSTYTLTLQDVTTSGSGFVNLYGVSVDGITYISYGGATTYPRVFLNADTGGSAVVWTQPTFSLVSSFFSGENGFQFTPSSSGRLTSIDARIGTSNTSITYRMRVRSGAGNSGTILFENSSYTFTINGFSLTNFSCGTSGPFLTSGNTYTYTLEVIAGTLSNSSIGGINSNGTYVIFNSSLYPQTNININNGGAAYSQTTSNTSTQIVSTSTEQGFQVVPSGSGTLLSFNIRLISYEGVASGRTLTVKVRSGAGVGGSLLTTQTALITNTSSKTDTTITMNAPSLTASSTYTLTVQDTTVSGNTNGVVYVYGVTQNVTYTAFNINTYPVLTILANSSVVSLFQSSAEVATSVVSTVTEQGFQITPNTTGVLTSIKINLSSFETVSSGRSLQLRVRLGSGVAGAIQYSNTFTLTNNLINSDVTFQVSSGPTLTASTVYTVTIQDTTVGGTSTGNIFIYGIYGNSTFITTNISIYPKLTVSLSVNTTFSIQPLNPTISSTISTVTEQGWQIIPTSSGFLTRVTLDLLSFDTSSSRTLTLRLRDGSGVSGTILYQANISIPNLSTRTDYSIGIDTSVAPTVSANHTYTLSVIDISAGGTATGNIDVYGIIAGGSYPAFNITTYPKMTTYIPSFIITISPPQDFAGFLADNTDNIEFNTQAHENATTLFYNGLPSTFASYYQIGLQYLVIPNQLLNVGNGGHLDNYPYVYVQLYNEGNSGSLKVINSNNPNSIQAMFKMPIDKNLYDRPTSFYTLKTTSREQIVRFRPDQNIRFRVTLPDGTVVSSVTADNFSPLFPNPFLQVNALFTLTPMDNYESR